MKKELNLSVSKQLVTLHHKTQTGRDPDLCNSSSWTWNF